jgi:hypothetical protein
MSQLHVLKRYIFLQMRVVLNRKGPVKVSTWVCFFISKELKKKIDGMGTYRAWPNFMLASGKPVRCSGSLCFVFGSPFSGVPPPFLSPAHRFLLF